ncbi:hypothetical protein [Mucilaginibacter sp.]
MRGINYITDENGNKSAVVIDMQTYAEQIEDFLDGIEASQRVAEPHEDYKVVMERIINAKLSGE